MACLNSCVMDVACLNSCVEYNIEVKGMKGDKGDKGDPGLSAYQVAVANGFVGTEEQWLASLHSATASACTAGDYCIVNTQIPLTVDVANFSKLLFVCGEDSGTEGVQTIPVALRTGKTYHKLTWLTGQFSTAYQWESFAYTVKFMTITIAENKVTIVASNVTSNGIRAIYAE